MRVETSGTPTSHHASRGAGTGHGVREPGPQPLHPGDRVRIGEDANTTVLQKEEWNVLVDLIQSGQLGRL